MFNIRATYSFLLFLIMLVSAVNAQQVYVETGLGSAFFEDYVNNKGANTLDESYTQPNTPFFEAGFKFDLYKKRIKLDVGTGYNTYKINTAFSSGNIKIPTSYDLSYVALKLGINLSLIKWKKLQLQVHSHISHDWLTAGTNRYNNVVFDLYKERTLDRTLLRFHRGLSIEYSISKRISTYLNYNIGNSLQEKNEDSQDGESYSFKTKSLSVGLLFNISKKYKAKKRFHRKRKIKK
ncbi:hypothetical protein [Polaribacter sp.]|uniref:hypothetical protein n=1 Tax=Polaribacter sp. TaxID=1920175 RepID=UPI003EF416A1